MPSSTYAQSDQIDIGHIQLKSENFLPSPALILTTPIPRKNPKPIFTQPSNLYSFTTGSINLSLSVPFLSFSALSPTQSQLRQTSLLLNVMGDSSVGFYLYTTNNLSNPNSKQIIPPTTCDNGNCSPTHSDSWSSTLTYGVGYNCVGGSYCPLAFANSHAYRPLATGLNNAVELDSQLFNTNQHYSFLYKINVSASQSLSSYSTNVQYLFLPNL